MIDSINVIEKRRQRLTLRRMLVIVAFVGFGLSLARGIYFCFATRFAPGFSESQFRKVQLGMTYREVEQIMGQPLKKDSTSPRWRGIDNWMYSEPAFLTNDEWRRWIMFQEGRVMSIGDEFVPD